MPRRIVLGIAFGAQAADNAATKAKPYTLKTCPVSDEKLAVIWVIRMC